MKWLSKAGMAIRGKRPSSGVSTCRLESNAWLSEHCGKVDGKVLSVGSSDDSDGQGGCYRDYFSSASAYVTSEVADGFGTDLVLDIQSMPEIEDGSFDAVFCSGVLEHLFDFNAAIREIHRVLSPGGVLLLGLPFQQGIHHAPTDYWRFTEHGIRHILKGTFKIQTLQGIPKNDPNFPAAYWCMASRMPQELRK